MPYDRECTGGASSNPSLAASASLSVLTLPTSLPLTLALVFRFNAQLTCLYIYWIARTYSTLS